MPTITGIPDRSVGVGELVGPVPFTVSDADTPNEALVLKRAWSNAALVPTTKVVFGGV